MNALVVETAKFVPVLTGLNEAQTGGEFFVTFQVCVWLDEAFDTETASVLLVAKDEDSKLTNAALVPRLMPLSDQEMLQLPSDGTTLKAFELVPRFGIVLVVPAGLTEPIEHCGYTCTLQLQIAVS